MVLCLSFLMFFSLNLPAFAVGSATPTSEKVSIDEIFNDYHSQLFLAEINKDEGSSARSLSTQKEIKMQTMQRLSDAGYEAYDVNKDTFTSVENTLNVEYATATSSLTGNYYDADINAYAQIPPNPESRIQYSDKALNVNWKRQMAVTGYLGNCIYYSVAGDVKYTHDGDVVLIHRENF